MTLTAREQTIQKILKVRKEQETLDKQIKQKQKSQLRNKIIIGVCVLFVLLILIGGCAIFNSNNNKQDDRIYDYSEKSQQPVNVVTQPTQLNEQTTIVDFLGIDWIYNNYSIFCTFIFGAYVMFCVIRGMFGKRNWW
jgi:hypothetical protein